MLAEIDAAGEISDATRFRLARKAFAHTAAYDGAIASHLGKFTTPDAPPADFPETLHVSGSLARALRYGENPHQKAAFYALDGAATGPSLARARVLQGKELSYNNLVDLDAALRICASSRSRRRRSSSTTTRAASRSPTRAWPTPTGAPARPIRCRRSAASSP